MLRSNRYSPSDRSTSLHHHLLFDLFKYVAVVGALSWLIFRGVERLGYNWQWYRVPAYLYSIENGRLTPGPLIDGLFITLQITVVSLILTFAFGLITAILRLSHSFAARGVSRGYLELMRNTPLLVQLFLIYFVLSPVLNLTAFTSAVLALSLFEGAYASEIFRAGIVSISRHQWEAAFSIGLSRWHTYRFIVLPLAVRRMLPPLTSQAVSLIKDSALVSTIAIYDLTMQGQIIIAQTYLVFELWFTIAAIYLVMTMSLSLTVYTLEKRLRVV
ncbi:MAG: amino acid ABC transporter permease, partial [Desulfobacterales bacterium]